MRKEKEAPKKEVKKAKVEKYKTEMEIEDELEKEQDKKLGRL